MDGKKHTNLTDSLMRLQALRDKVRLTEEAQIRQQNLRKEYEEKTEKLIAENDKISAKLLAKQKTSKKYRDIVENLIRQKAELEKKLHILQGRVQENENVQSEHKKVQSEHEKVQSEHDKVQSESVVVAKPMIRHNETEKEHEEVKYNTNTTEEIWELKKSIEEIESQLAVLEQEKD